MRIHREQSSCFAQFTQQISSVSTEQCQAGVKSSLKRLRIKRVDFGKVRGKRKRAATEKCEAARSEFFGTNSKETDCENVFRDLKHWRTISNLREFVKLRHSGEESPLG